MVGIVNLALAATAIAAMSASVAAVTVANWSFESPNVGASFLYGPVVAGNSFNGSAGVQGNGSAWGFVAAPDGTQTAFLQSFGSSTGTISLDISGLTAGATYSVSFHLADRPGYGDNPVALFHGNLLIGSFAAPSTAWTQFTSGPFTASGNSGMLTFAAGPNTGYDAGVGLDAVTVTQLSGVVPEPGSWALLITGFGLTGAALRRRRTAVA